MTRVPEVTSREALAPEHRAAFDEIAGSRGGRVAGPFRVLLHSPEVARRIAHTGAFIRFESTLPEEISELAVIAATREFDCQYAYAAHEANARNAGVREEAIRAIRDLRAPEGLTQDEAVVVRYVQELLRAHRVSEPTFQAALKRFGIRTLTELTAIIGYYGMIACVLNAFDVQPDRPLLPA